MPEPTIVAIGGDALVEDPARQHIERYILSLTGSDYPRVCYIGTANGDAPVFIVRFYSVFTSEICRPSHLNLVDRRVNDLRSFLLGQDVIFIGGGNTAAALAIWRMNGVDELLREAWQQGIVLCGSSAGGNCWHEASVTDSFSRDLDPLNDGLGFLPGSFCPHYDAEPKRRPQYQHFIAGGLIKDGIACDNNVALHYEGTTLKRIISARPEARAWRLTRSESGFNEEELVPEYLGTSA